MEGKFDLNLTVREGMLVHVHVPIKWLLKNKISGNTSHIVKRSNAILNLGHYERNMNATVMFNQMPYNKLLLLHNNIILSVG